MSRVRAMGHGRPVASFVALLLGWVALRVVTFETPFPADAASPPSSGPDVSHRAAEGMAPLAAAPLAARSMSGGGHAERAAPMGQGVRAAPERRLMAPPERTGPAPVSAFFAPDRMAAGHELAWMAAMAEMPMPVSVATLIDERQNAQDRANARRWHVDGWLLLRPGQHGRSPAGLLLPSYGASQIGAVLAYRLAAGSERQPVAYLRVSRALVHDGESEAAVGIGLRPVAALAITARAELRATRRANGTELRPAAFLVGGFDRLRLPLGVEARGYAQAGYVGGKYATGFVDGQAVAAREVAAFDLARISAGAGVWGGAQKGASRIDVGPTASVDVTLASAPVRVSLDYRQRVAGQAEPSSGGALTLSTGF